MSDPDLVVVKTYLSAVEADIDRARLEGEGIPAMVRSDDCGGMRPHLWMRGVELLVRAEDADDVRALLGADGPSPDGIPADSP